MMVLMLHAPAIKGVQNQPTGIPSPVSHGPRGRWLQGGDRIKKFGFTP